MSISKQRIKELERAEAKLNALEAGGVDNWDCYDEALSEYNAENELEERREDLILVLAEVFGECAYEPSERGAGISFNDDTNDLCAAILEKFGVNFNALKKEVRK